MLFYFFIIIIIIIFVFLPFLVPLPQHMEVPRLGFESELQLPAYDRATAMRDLSHVCNLHHRSQQCWILNPLCKARDRTHNLMVPSGIRFHCAMMGTPFFTFFNGWKKSNTTPAAYGGSQARD